MLVGLLGAGVLLLALDRGEALLPDLGALQEQAEVAYPPPAGASLVQTFRLTTPSLAALDLLLERPPAAPATGTLWLSLRSGDGRLLATGALPADAIQGPGWFRLAVPSGGRPGEGIYRLEVTTDAAASVWVRGSAAAVYPDGRLTVGGQVLPGALAFRAHYRYDLPLLLQDLGTGWRSGLWLAVLSLLLVGPGLLWERALAGPQPRPLRLAWWTGLSLALWPLGLLWGRTLWGAAGLVIGPPLVVLVWRRARRSGPAGADNATPVARDRSAVGPVAFGVVLVGALVVRLVPTRGLPGPLWVDGLQHAFIAGLIADQGGLPATYAPLLPETPFSYHFGFHLLVALVHRLSGLEVALATLLTGQVLSALVVLSVALLALVLWQSDLGALGAALVVAFWTLFPAYALSWGRYPQLAGLLCLVVVLGALDEVVRTGRRAAVVLGALALAGLALTHPRILVVAGLLGGLWLLVQPARGPALPLVGLAGLLTLPWHLHEARTLWPVLWRGTLALPPGSDPFPWDLVLGEHDRPLVALALLGWLAAAGWRPRVAGAVLGTVAGLVLVANPDRLGLPGSRLLGNTTLASLAFLLIALGLGGLLACGADRLRLAARPAWVQTMVWILVLVLGLTGAPRALGVLNPETLLLWPADLPALRWVAAATPPESLFTVNLRLWQTGIYTGTDGGYWLPVLAGRPALVPPPVYVHGPAARERHARLAALAAAQADPARYLALARAAGAQYLFVGARGGPLPLDLLDRQPGLRLVYSDGRARVYRLAD